MEGRGGALPCLFLKIAKSALILGKKGPDIVVLWVKFSIENVVLRVSRRKTEDFWGLFFSCVLNEMFFEVP